MLSLNNSKYALLALLTVVFVVTGLNVDFQPETNNQIEEWKATVSNNDNCQPSVESTDILSVNLATEASASITLNEDEDDDDDDDGVWADVCCGPACGEDYCIGDGPYTCCK